MRRRSIIDTLPQVSELRDFDAALPPGVRSNCLSEFATSGSVAPVERFAARWYDWRPGLLRWARHASDFS